MRKSKKFNGLEFRLDLLELLKSPASIPQIVKAMGMDETSASYQKIRFWIRKLTNKKLLRYFGKGIVRDGRLIFYFLTKRGAALIKKAQKIQKELRK